MASEVAAVAAAAVVVGLEDDASVDGGRREGLEQSVQRGHLEVFKNTTSWKRYLSDIILYTIVRKRILVGS